MSFEFNSKDQTIEETLLGISSLRVPQFQRPYSWEVDNCADLWNDLIDNDSFFLGQFILNYEYQSEEGYVDIVDGQQRTTTILILCAVLRDMALELGFEKDAKVIHTNAMIARLNFSGPSYKILVSPTVIEFFQKHIQNNTDTITENTVFNKDNLEEKRIVKNYLFFKDQLLECLMDMNSDEKISKIRSIYEFLCKTKIIVTKINNENDAYEIFESVNATGLDLEVSDLLKNFLFKKIKSEGGNSDEIIDKWTEIVESIPSLELAKFIRYYWLSTQKDFVTEAKLFKSIKERHRLSWVKFLEELLKNAKIYGDLRSPLEAEYVNDSNGARLKNALIGIKEMNITQCYVLLLSIIRNKGRINTNWLNTIELIEKFNFVYHTTSKLPANKVEKLYQQWAFEIETKAQEVNPEIRRVSLETLFNSIKNKLKSLLPSKELFVSGFIEITYKKRGLCRYILSRIEESYGTKEFILNHPLITIEHVLPQKPGPAWNLTQKQIKNYVHNIGNLTLLGKKPNGTIQNKSLSEKMSILRGSTEIKITKHLLDELEETNVWNDETIKKRAQILANIAYTGVWKIS